MTEAPTVSAANIDFYSEIKVKGFSAFKTGKVLDLGGPNGCLKTWKGKLPIPGFGSEKVLFQQKTFTQVSWEGRLGQTSHKNTPYSKGMIRFPVCKIVRTKTFKSGKKAGQTKTYERYSLDTTSGNPMEYVWMDKDDMTTSNNFHEKINYSYWSTPRLEVHKFFLAEVAKTKKLFVESQLGKVATSSGMTLEQLYEKQREELKAMWEARQTGKIVNVCMVLKKALGSLEQTTKLVAKRRLNEAQIDALMGEMRAVEYLRSSLREVTIEAAKEASKKWDPRVAEARAIRKKFKEMVDKRSKAV